MKYTTEFQVIQEAPIRTNSIDFLKKENLCRLSEMIGERIGFKKIDQDQISGNDRYKLEIQVFSQKDWIEFKKEIRDYLINSFDKSRADYELVQFKTMFDRLESIEKAEIELK